MIEIFVENYKLDVSSDAAAMLSYSIDDIKEFGSKNTTYSKPFVLPGTKKNNIAFGNIFNVTAFNNYDPTQKNININFNAAVAAKCIIFQSNIQMFKGVLRVMRVVLDDGFIEYEVNVFGELGGFLTKLGNLKLEDLDFSSLNHTYNLTNIVASWDNYDTGAGYYYPLIDYGNYSIVKHDWKVGTFRPALFAKEFIDKIFTNSTYTYDSTLINSTRFKTLKIPHNKKALQRKSTSYLDVSSNGSSYEVVVGSYIIEYNTLTLLGNFTNDIDNKIFTYAGSSAIIASIETTIKGNWNCNNGTSYNASLIFYVSTPSGDIEIGNIPISQTNFDIKSLLSNINISPSNSINIFYLVGDPTDPSLTFDVIFTSNLKVLSNYPVLLPINFGEDIPVNDILPQNILQKDFISSIAKLFNVYIFEDAQTEKLIKIEPFVDFYANADVIDWSNKIDRSKPITLTPMSELNARYYEFNYKDDTDFYNDLYKKRYNQSYCSYKYDSEFEFAKESHKVELIFSPTVLVGYNGEDKVYSTIFKRSGNSTGLGEENVDSNIRLLLGKKIGTTVPVTNWNITNDAGTTLGTYTVYPYMGHLDDPDAPANDLGFGVPKELFFQLGAGALNVNQFNLYWSSYMAEITDKDSRLLEATFKLDFKDICNLDFSKLIYIDGQLYRLNTITDFNVTVEETCKVSLLKIINRIY